MTARRAARTQRSGALPARPFTAYEYRSTQPQTCRVCSGDILPSTTALRRARSLEWAHVGCGWLRPDEHEPHALTGAEIHSRLFEWACPACSRDVVRRELPTNMDERRCTPCIQSGRAVEPQDVTVADTGARAFIDAVLHDARAAREDKEK